METKTVALRRDAYDLLRSQKRPGESFSDVVVRIVGRRAPLSSFAGAWKDMPEKEFAQVQQAIQSGRELGRKRMERVLKRAGLEP